MITLYNAARCPYVARVRIVLAEKGIPRAAEGGPSSGRASPASPATFPAGFETVEIDLSDRPAWFYEKNLTGRVPVIEEDGGPPLPESAVIMEFLEERYPEPALLPADPVDRAFVAEEFDAALGRFDTLLGERPYLGGAEYGLADIALVPWFLRARDTLGVELDAFSSLSDWLARLEQRPAIAAEVGVVAAL